MGKYVATIHTCIIMYLHYTPYIDNYFQTTPTLVLILGATGVDLGHLVEQKNSLFVGLNLVPSHLLWKMEEIKNIDHGSLILTMRPLIYTEGKSVNLYTCVICIIRERKSYVY